MLVAAILSLASQSPSVIVREPRAPAEWRHEAKARCGSTRIVITGYGAGGPGVEAALFINGKSDTTAVAKRFSGDLSDKSGVYRITVLCTGAVAVVRINKGLKVNKDLRFASGVATIGPDGRIEYDGLRESDSTTFWFK